MQVHLRDEEIRQQMEIEAYDKIKEEEMEQKKLNDKEKRQKADKKFQIIVFSIIGLVMLVVLLKWLNVF